MFKTIFWSGLVGILIGIAVGTIGTIFLYFHIGFSFSKEINLGIDPLGVISLLVTVALALYFTQKLSDKSIESRTTKDLLIERLGSLENQILEKVRSTYHHKTFEFIQQVTKVIRTSVKEELDLLVSYSVISVDNPKSLLLQTRTTELWTLLTFVPPSGSETDTSTRVDSGKIIYSTETIEEIGLKLSQIKRLIVDLQIIVNSSTGKLSSSQ